MIQWILHRPPHASSQSEIRVAELLRRLEESTHQWTVIWGYYFIDGRGIEREGDFLILGPAGGLLVLEVKSSLPRHFPETGRWEGAGGDDPISQLNTEWQGVIHGIRAKGDAPFVEKALCVPGVNAPEDVENFQGIPRKWLVAGNDLENWVSTWLRIFGNRVRNPVDPLQKRAVLEAFGQGSLPEEKRAFVDHTEQLFERQFTSRFALLDQLSENRQLLIHGGTGTGKTWHAPSATPARAMAAVCFFSRTIRRSPPNSGASSPSARSSEARLSFMAGRRCCSSSAHSRENPSPCPHQAVQQKPSARFMRSNCHASFSSLHAIPPSGQNGRCSMH